MERRDFIKAIGVAGIFSLMRSVPLHASGSSALDPTDADGLKGPFDLAFDAEGNLYVTDPANYRFVRLDRSLKPVAYYSARISAREPKLPQRHSHRTRRRICGRFQQLSHPDIQ